MRIFYQSIYVAIGALRTADEMSWQFTADPLHYSIRLFFRKFDPWELGGFESLYFKWKWIVK